MVAVGVAYWARKSDLESIINSENEMMEAQMLSADQYLLVSRMTQSAAETPVRPERIKIEARIASHRKWRRRRALLRLQAAVFGRRWRGPRGDVGGPPHGRTYYPGVIDSNLTRV